MGRIAREVLLYNGCFAHVFTRAHVHMVVEIEDVLRFSQGMKVLKKSYTHQYNIFHKRFWPVWRDRYKVKLIENEVYLNVCGSYVEQNPVEAGMVEKSIDWPYSSSRYYELGEEDVIVDRYDRVEVRPMEIVKSNEFEKIKAVGSDWFQYQVGKKLKS